MAKVDRIDPRHQCENKRREDYVQTGTSNSIGIVTKEMLTNLSMFSNLLRIDFHAKHTHLHRRLQNPQTSPFIGVVWVTFLRRFSIRDHEIHDRLLRDGARTSPRRPDNRTILGWPHSHCYPSGLQGVKCLLFPQQFPQGPSSLSADQIPNTALHPWSRHTV